MGRVGITILFSQQVSKMHSDACFSGHLNQVVFLMYWLGNRHNIKIKLIGFLTPGLTVGQQGAMSLVRVSDKIMP